MGSLKSFLKPGRPSTSDFVRFLRMLLQGLSAHVLEGDSEELTAYRSDTGLLEERLNDDASSEDILVTVTRALRALDDYNRRTKKFLLAQTLELKTALRAATDTISMLIQSRTDSADQLTIVEKKMEQASAIEDIRELRRKLQDCLMLIRDEGVRLRTESADRIEVLKQQVESAMRGEAGLSRLADTLDSVTGLEGRVAAEKRIADRIVDRKPCVIALFVINRLATINRRYGRAIGDDVLMLVAQHLGQLLPAASILFRWSGPALAAVVEIQPNFDDVSRKLTRIASGQLEKNIDDGERSLFVPIMTLLQIQKVTVVSVAKEIFGRMDQFVFENDGDQQAAG